MKILLLSINQIRNIYVKSKLFFFIFTVSFITSAITLISMYGDYYNSMTKSIENNMERRRISIEFNEACKDYSIIENIYGKFADEIEEVKIILGTYNVKRETGEIVPFEILSYIPEYKNRIIFWGKKFSEQQKENGENVIIISQMYEPNNELNRINYSVFIDNTSFEIVGIQLRSTEQILADIPYNTVKKNRFAFKGISFVVSKDLYLKFEAELREVLRDSQSYEIIPASYSKSTEMLFLQKMLYAILFVSLAIINIMMIYNYLLKIRKKEFAVMSIIGASENTLIKLIFLELFIILSVAYLVAVIFNKLIYIPLLHKIDIYYTSRIIDYVIMFLLIFFIACIPLVFMMFKHILRSPAQNRQRSLE